MGLFFFVCLFCLWAIPNCAQGLFLAVLRDHNKSICMYLNVSLIACLLCCSLFLLLSPTHIFVGKFHLIKLSALLKQETKNGTCTQIYRVSIENKRHVSYISNRQCNSNMGETICSMIFYMNARDCLWCFLF